MALKRKKKAGPGKKAAPSKAAPSTLNIGFILDESGSMFDVETETINGFNEFIEDQKRSGVKATLTLTKFNTVCTRVHTCLPISEVKPLDSKSYVPGGMTALHDAVAKTIKDLNDSLPADERVLCCILTDGEENSSREHSLTEVKKLIEAMQSTGRWTFVFLGAGKDAWVQGTARMMGIPVGNAAAYTSTGSGTQAAIRCMSHNTVTYGMSNLSNTSNYFAGVSSIPDPGAAVDPYVKPTPTAPPVTARTTKDRPTWKKGR